MGRKSFQHEMLGRSQSRRARREVVDADSQAAHAGIDFQVHRLPCHAQRGCGLIQRLDMPRFPNRGSEMQADDLAFLASPEAGHQKNVGANARLAQRNRFVERSHAQPARTFRLQRARALDRAVTVSVGFHHGAHGHVRSHVLLHRAEVLPQRA